MKKRISRSSWWMCHQAEVRDYIGIPTQRCLLYTRGMRFLRLGQTAFQLAPAAS